MEKNQNPLSSLNEEIARRHDYFFLCVDGVGGKGKTVMLTMLAVFLHENYNKVYANFELIGIPNFERLPKKLNKHIILSLKPNSLILLTEAYIYFDCRECMKTKNIDTTHSLFQARKKGFDIFFDIPSFKYTELRLKEWTKLVVRARGKRDNTKEGENIFGYDICSYLPDYDMLQTHRIRKQFNMKNIFKRFKSFEVIDYEPTLETFMKENQKEKKKKF